MNTAVSCIITSLNDPNMIVLLHKKYNSKQYILYQSQPQNDKGLNGPYILVFTGIWYLLLHVFHALNEYKLHMFFYK